MLNTPLSATSMARSVLERSRVHGYINFHFIVGKSARTAVIARCDVYAVAPRERQTATGDRDVGHRTCHYDWFIASECECKRISVLEREIERYVSWTERRVQRALDFVIVIAVFSYVFTNADRIPMCVCMHMCTGNVIIELPHMSTGGLVRLRLAVECD